MKNENGITMTSTDETRAVDHASPLKLSVFCGHNKKKKKNVHNKIQLWCFSFFCIFQFGHYSAGNRGPSMPYIKSYWKLFSAWIHLLLHLSDLWPTVVTNWNIFNIFNGSLSIGNRIEQQYAIKFLASPNVSKPLFR